MKGGRESRERVEGVRGGKGSRDRSRVEGVREGREREREAGVEWKG